MHPWIMNHWIVYCELAQPAQQWVQKQYKITLVNSFPHANTTEKH